MSTTTSEISVSFQSALRLKEPIENCDVNSDIKTIATTKGIEQPVAEQLLPDFYAEHTALAMNRERRRQVQIHYDLTDYFELCRIIRSENVGKSRTVYDSIWWEVLKTPQAPNWCKCYWRRKLEKSLVGILECKAVTNVPSVRLTTLCAIKSYVEPQQLLECLECKTVTNVSSVRLAIFWGVGDQVLWNSNNFRWANV